MEKKVVHYDRLAGVQQIGERVILIPVDHPDTVNVTNGRYATTSKVESWDITSGRIETRNTIYIPAE